MLKKIKEKLSQVIGDNLTKEQIDTIQEIDNEIIISEENITKLKTEYDELKTDYIKAIKSTSFNSAHVEVNEKRSLEDIAKEILNKGGKK